jgi:hypothetical protein
VVFQDEPLFPYIIYTLLWLGCPLQGYTGLFDVLQNQEKKIMPSGIQVEHTYIYVYHCGVIK